MSKAELRCTSCLHAKAMELFEGLVPCSIDSDVFAVRELQSSRLRFPEDYPVLVGCAAKLFAAGEKVAEDFNARSAILLYECDMTADPSGRSLLPDPFGVGMAMEMASALRAFASSAEHVLAKVRLAMLSGGPGADLLALDGQTKLQVTLEPEDTHRGFNVAKLNLNEFSLLKQLETLQHICGQGKKFAEENRVVLIQASLFFILKVWFLVDFIFVQIVEHAINSCVEACHFLDFIKDETTGQDAQKHFLNTIGARVVETMWQSDEEEDFSEDDHDDFKDDTESDEEAPEMPSPTSPPRKVTCAGAKALELVGKARAKVVPAIRSDSASDADSDSARPSKKARV